jgi:hypothetical protein
MKFDEFESMIERARRQDEHARLPVTKEEWSERRLSWFGRFMSWLRGPRCPGCGHRAARHHPSCDDCICSRWGERWGYQARIGGKDGL